MVEINRVKYHLAKIGGFNVRPCKKVTDAVKEEMVALLTKKTCQKEEKKKEKQRERDEIDLDKSDGDKSSEEDSDNGNEVIVLKQTRGSGSSCRPQQVVPQLTSSTSPSPLKSLSRRTKKDSA